MIAHQGPFCPVMLPQTIEARCTSGRMRIEFEGLAKRCSGCGLFLPADTGFFCLRSDSPDGLRGDCLWCHADMSARQRIAA